jgi:hypothetical protein
MRTEWSCVKKSRRNNANANRQCMGIACFSDVIAAPQHMGWSELTKMLRCCRWPVSVSTLTHEYVAIRIYSTVVCLSNSSGSIQSWECNCHSAYKDISSFLWKMEVHGRVHWISPVDPILNQMNPFYTITPYILHIQFNMISHLCLCLQSGPFPPHFLTTTLYEILILHESCISHPPHPLWFVHFSVDLLSLIALIQAVV